MTNIQDRLIKINKVIAEYENKYRRQKGSVQLLVVSKNQPIEAIMGAYKAGQLRFGESYLQEALPKIEALPAAEWHFIAPIQSNKARKIAENFAWVHTVDSEKIAKRLNDLRPLCLPALNICIQVNVSEEKTKSGIKITELIALANFCIQMPRLKLRGLMAIPAPSNDLVKQREIFHQLALLCNTLHKLNPDIDTLSMGMSNDFEAAIAEGATIVRLGSIIWQPASL